MTGTVPALIWCPFANEEDARDAAGMLLDEQLVVCANILGEMVSLYNWKGAREEACECGALFKTAAHLLAPAIARLAEIHPYDTPAIIGWRCDDASTATREWLGDLPGANRGKRTRD